MFIKRTQTRRKGFVISYPVMSSDFKTNDAYLNSEGFWRHNAHHSPYTHVSVQKSSAKAQFVLTSMIDILQLEESKNDYQRPDNPTHETAAHYRAFERSGHGRDTIDFNSSDFGRIEFGSYEVDPRVEEL